MKKILCVLALSIIFQFFTSSLLTAAEINWEGITPYKVNMFYTGVASWEFLTSKDHGVGRVPVQKNKKTCRECHISKEGTFDIQVAEVIKGTLLMKASKKSFEPNPLPNKPPIVYLNLQAAYDNENIYLRLQWESAGKSWKSPDSDKPDRVAIQMNAAREEFKRFGCFINCHNDQNSMPDSPSKDKVAKHPYYSKQKRNDVRLYAFYTRNEEWSSLKDGKEVGELLKQGGLTDLWLAAFKGKKLEAADQWILEDRQGDANNIEGTGTWESGKYTVILKRKLNTGDERDIQLKDGEAFTVGIAIHDDEAKLRQHYVSFPFSIGMGAAGDLTATKIK